MGTVRESIDIAVPVRVAYQMLCHFEGYPRFMPGVRSVTQISRTKVRWIVELDGLEAEFDTAITDRRPDEILAWHSLEGPRLAETVTFERLSDTTTRITAERDGDATDLPPDDARLKQLFNQRLRDDLTGFKEYMENATHRPTELTGAGGAIGAGPVPTQRIGADSPAGALGLEQP